MNFIKENIAYLVISLLIALAGICIGNVMYSPVYSDLSILRTNTGKVFELLNEMKTNEKLKYEVSPLALKENHLLFAAVLGERIEENQNIYQNNIDTTFYILKPKNSLFYIDYDLVKVELNKKQKQSIYNYISEGEWISLNSWFR